MTILVNDVTVKIMAGANERTVSKNSISKRTETFSGSCRLSGSCNLSIGVGFWAPQIGDEKNTKLARIKRIIVDLLCNHTFKVLGMV